MHTTIDETAPAARLWNADAAVSWSLLFTPAFGAYIQMRNWEALGEPGLAASARRWLNASMVLLGLRLCAGALATRLQTETGVMAVLSTGFFLAWYCLAARVQGKAIRARLGPAYPRRQWDGAVLVALMGAVVYAAASACLALLLVALT